VSRPLVILASGSPRRSELLHQIGVPHEIVPAHIPEQHRAGESAAQCALRLASEKALAVPSRAALPVVGADTIVVIDGLLLGKPRDREQALEMLARLSGRTHEVLSAVAVAHLSEVRSALARSEVSFRKLARAECEAYWDSGEPRDKAGAYAIQGLGAVFIEALQGSYSGVMGLPLFETAQLLAAAGVPLWRGVEDRVG
jgi:septum formation protein